MGIKNNGWKHYLLLTRNEFKKTVDEEIKDIEAFNWIEKAPGLSSDLPQLSSEVLAGKDLRLGHFNFLDMTGLDLTGRDLTLADMQGICANKAIFTNADLKLAVLVGAILEEANFTNTCLLAANLSSANLKKAILRNAVLEHANLTKTNLIGADARGADFTGTDLTNATLDYMLIDEETKLDYSTLSRQQLLGISKCEDSQNVSEFYGKLQNARIEETEEELENDKKAHKKELKNDKKALQEIVKAGDGNALIDILKNYKTQYTWFLKSAYYTDAVNTCIYRISHQLKNEDDDTVKAAVILVSFFGLQQYLSKDKDTSLLPELNKFEKTYISQELKERIQNNFQDNIKHAAKLFEMDNNREMQSSTAYDEADNYNIGISKKIQQTRDKIKFYC